MLLTCFVMLNATNEVTFAKNYQATEENKKYRDDEKFIDGVRD